MIFIWAPIGNDKIMLDELVTEEKFSYISVDISQT